MKNEIVRVDFHGGDIQAVKNEQGVWVSVRRVCEHLGIDEEGQRQKLKDENRAPWACACVIQAHDTTGRKQDAFMLHLDSLPMWLATIDAGRVNSEARALLIAYQKEAARVLRDYFFGPQRERKTETPIERERRLLAREERLLREQNAKGYRLAIELAKRNCPTVAPMYEVKLAEALSGENLDCLLPPMEEKTFWKSAEQIAAEIGCTAHRVGVAISGIWGRDRHNLKGIREVRMSKSKHSEKTVEQSFYSPDAVAIIKGKISDED